MLHFSTAQLKRKKFRGYTLKDDTGNRHDQDAASKAKRNQGGLARLRDGSELAHIVQKSPHNVFAQQMLCYWYVIFTDKFYVYTLWEVWTPSHGIGHTQRLGEFLCSCLVHLNSVNTSNFHIQTNIKSTNNKVTNHLMRRR